MLPTTWDANEPELPYQILTFLVPVGTRVATIRTQSEVAIEIAADIDLAPAQPMFDEQQRKVQPKLAPEAAAGGLYPPALAVAAGGGALHGYQLASVRVHPVRWDRTARRLIGLQSVDLEIELAAGGQRPLERERYRPEIEELAQRMLERLVANPDAIESYNRRLGMRVEWTGRGFRPSDAPSLEGSDVDYVIVTSEALAPAWQVLAEWKTRRGMPTVVRTTEWILSRYRHGSDQAETIRNFLQDAYARWGIRYALLGGDTEVVPARFGFSGFAEPSEQNIPTDMYFACLDGFWNLDGDARWGESAVDFNDPGDSTDMYAEVFVGRAPVTTPAEVGLFTAKVLSYESPGQLTYQKQHVMLSEVIFPVDWPPGTPITIDGGQYSEDILALSSACIDTVRYYENYTGWPGSLQITKAAVLAAMNAGPGFVNHVGHGFRYNMSCGDASIVNTDAMLLTNGARRFILYMLNCSAAAFDYPCLAEAFLKAQGGAVAVIGATRSAFAVPSRNYNREYFRAVHIEGLQHIGDAFVESRLPYTSNTFFDTADKYTHLLYTLLADPEMVIHTCEVRPSTATYAVAVPTGPQAISVHVEVDGAPRAEALVCLSKGTGGTEAYAFGRTDAAGDVTLPFQAESSGPINVTVSGANMTTHFGTIAVFPPADAYLHVQALALDDDASPPTDGDGNDRLDAGETISYDITVRNTGPMSTTGVTGLLRVASPWATVVDSSFTVGDVNKSGGLATSIGEVLVHVSHDAPDGVALPFTFILADATHTWTDRLNRVVEAPDLRVVLTKVEDPAPGGNGDGVIQAGETFDLAVTLKNYGSGGAMGVTATLASSDPQITIVDGTMTVGAVGGSQQVVPADRFRLTESTLDENPLTITTVDGHGRTRVLPITLRPPNQPPPPALSPRAGANTVFLSWTPSSEADHAGYHVYRAVSGSGPWTRITTDRTFHTAYYLDVGVESSTLYFYRTTSIDVAGNESAPSTASSINTSPPQLQGWPIGLGASSVCPVAVGDVTGDGLAEVAAGADHLYAWDRFGVELLDGDNEAETWGVVSRLVRTVSSAIAMADLDTEPGLDIFCAAWDDSTKAFAFRGTGELLPGWPQNPGPFTTPRGFWASTAAIDVDNDGLAELFAPARNGVLYAWRANGSPLGATVAFKSGFGANIRSSPAFANLDSDSDFEIVFAAPNGELHVWNKDGSSVPGWPVTAGPAVLSNPAIGDVNDDGVLDIVLETEGAPGLVHVYNSQTATELPGWPKMLILKGNPISPSPALADFDGDGKLEIVVANNGGTQPSLSKVQIFDWQGNILSGWPRSVGDANSEASPIVADVTGDGVSDVLFANESGFLYGWDWHGVPLTGFPITIGDFVRGTPFVTDVDGDGNVNVLLAGWDRRVYVWDFDATWYPEAAQWPTLKHDVHRSGTYGFVYDSSPPALPTTLESSSHTPLEWSNDPTVDVNWTAAFDPSGIDGYSFEWSNLSTTLPDEDVDTIALSTTSPPIAENSPTWFHLRVVDKLGHWSPGALHLGPFRIDQTPPANTSSATPDRPPLAWSNDGTITMHWVPVVEPEKLGSRPDRRRLAPPFPTAATSLPTDRSGSLQVADPRDAGHTSGFGGRRGVAAYDPRRPEIAASGIAGYSIVWNLVPGTVPDAVVEVTSPQATSPLLANGTSHWFHVRSVDGAGNPSPPDSTLHVGPFWIDTTPPSGPTTFLPVPPIGEWAPADSIAVQWSGASDALSGIAGYSWSFTPLVSTQPDSTIDPAPNGAVLDPAPEGVTWFHLRTLDVAGNSSAVAHLGPFRLDRTAPAITVVAPNGGEQWSQGSSQTIRWQAVEAHAGIAILEIHYSTDGGATFPNLIAAVAPTDTAYSWSVPNELTTSARVRVRAVDGADNVGLDTSDANFALIAPTDVLQVAPVTRTWLDGAVPNPFNPTTRIRYSVLETGQVRLVIYDTNGRRVRTLVDGVQTGPRWYAPVWDGRDEAGRVTASGVYMARLDASGTSFVRRLVLVR